MREYDHIAENIESAVIRLVRNTNETNGEDLADLAKIKNACDKVRELRDALYAQEQQASEWCKKYFELYDRCMNTEVEVNVEEEDSKCQ